jgi:ComF family protein
MRPLLDLLYPPRCPGCRAIGGSSGSFCRACRETFAELPLPHCDRCCEPDVQGLCPHCQRERPAFEHVTVPFLFGGALADAVHRLKYEDRPHLAGALAAVALAAARDDLAWCDLAVPVPLHVRRLKERGYDQALLLARAFAKATKRPLEARALQRIRETPPQVGLNRRAREQNVRGAFAASPPLVQGKRVLLVDDVLTTGSTAHAASLALLEAGVTAVRVLALARAL